MKVWTEERITRANATLLKWHGTPHRDRIAVVGVGIDCIHFILETLFDADILPRVEVGSYGTTDGLHQPSNRLANAIEACLHVERVSIDAVQFGDIAVGRTGQSAAHVAFIQGQRIWHSLANVGVTHGQFKIWRHKIQHVYRLTDCGFKSLDFQQL